MRAHPPPLPPILPTTAPPGSNSLARLYYSAIGTRLVLIAIRARFSLRAIGIGSDPSNELDSAIIRLSIAAVSKNQRSAYYSYISHTTTK